jgi:hypothetical protein
MKEAVVPVGSETYGHGAPLKIAKGPAMERNREKSGWFPSVMFRNSKFDLWVESAI